MSCMWHRNLALILLLTLQSAVAHADRYALLVGIADYSGTGFTSLEGPLNDINLVHGLLMRRFGVPESNIRILLDRDATHTGLSSAFAALAERVKPGDSVYIHYAGHGSYMPDLNGDERSGFDQTWVSYGARSHAPGAADALDDFDVLDDEIQTWLAPILAKTDDVVFVSDSCHSASVTRGEAPRVRAIPGDTRVHPFGNVPLVKVKDSDRVIRIGAAGDAQGAGEFSAPDDQHYGLFTWYWVSALQAAHPGTTWREAFQQASARVLARRGDSQRPQMEGLRDRDIFGGDFKAPDSAVAVKMLRNGGRMVVLDAGLLNGVTLNSVYQLKDDDQAQAKQDVSRLKIITVNTLDSVAEVLSGEFQPGDLAVEESHVYPLDPVPVFLNADFSGTVDQSILDALKQLISRLPEYSLVESQADSELVLYVVRPRYDSTGTPVYRDSLQTLPDSAQDQPPEVWVLTPEESLLHENLRHGFTDIQQGVQTLQDNLRRLARVREVKALGNVGGGTPAIEMEALKLKPVAACPPAAASDCFEFSKGSYRVAGRYAADQLASESVTGEDILTFRLTNQSLYDWYVYLLDISPDGKISPLFPRTGKRVEDALLGKARTIDLIDEDTFLFPDQSGEEVVKVILSRQPIDINLLTQSGYQRAERGALNPLEQLLAGALHGTRGSMSPIPNNQWGTMELSFNVTTVQYSR